MLERLLGYLTSLGHWGYVLIFLGPFLESSAFLGLIVPGESIVVLAGFLAAHGYLDVGDCIVVIALGAILGDSTGYALGKAMGRDYFQRHDRIFLFRKKHLQKVDAYFARHGGKTIFWARFVHLLRAMTPFAAGMSAMPYGRFALFNVAGGIVWAAGFTLLGYFFGQSWRLVEKWAGRAGVFVLFMVLVVVLFGSLYKKLADNREGIVQWLREKASSPYLDRIRQQHPDLAAFIVRRLTPGSYLGLHLTVGLSLSAVFIWIFGGITEDILTGDPFVAVDQWVVGRVLYFRSPLATSFMEAVTQLGGIRFIAVASLAAIAFHLMRRHFDKAAGFAAAIVGGSLLNSILKTVIHRPRPISETTLVAAQGWSFPSGHAMMSVIFYGMIAYLLVRSVDSWRLKAFFMALAAFLVFTIGFSRIYLQVHYLSDVVAGFAGGLFWLSICITGLEVFIVKRKIASEPAAEGNRTGCDR
ncbi:MAG: bifunctional DedA family/phosphatase PAP2 family protein [Deltaproteobacteria bacterium]|nr:bifunctional DedA family/phosphatase PAP2 family protein [Deltaproteobacteria bacterium]